VPLLFMPMFFCMRCKSSRDTWKIASSDAFLELLSHSSFLCAFFSNTVRPWRLCASLKSRRRHPSYSVRCTCRRVVPWMPYGFHVYAVLLMSQFCPLRTRTTVLMHNSEGSEVRNGCR